MQGETVHADILKQDSRGTKVRIIPTVHHPMYGYKAKRSR